MKWYKDDPIRFAIETKLLGKYHKGVKVIIDGGKVRLEFGIRTPNGCYQMEARFPDEFPYSPMRVFVRSPEFNSVPPHRYGDGALCLHRYEDVGPETTAKVYLDWTKQWILTYEKWLKTGDWPEGNR